jgi:hypothetical protein
MRRHPCRMSTQVSRSHPIPRPALVVKIFIRANFQSKTTAQTGIAPNSERAAAAFGELSTIGSLP